MGVVKMNYAQTMYICPSNTQIGADYITTIFNKNIRKVTIKGNQPLAYYKKMENAAWKCETSEDYYSKCLSLPMYPTLTDAEQEYVISQITEFYNS